MLPTLWIQAPKRSFCPASLVPIGRDGVPFGSEGKLYSLVKEWRGVSGLRVHAFPERLWAGLLNRVLFHGGRGGLLQVQRRRIAHCP